MIKYRYKSGLTLMELLVVLLILGILVVFGMSAISMMNREHAQRKLPQAMYNNLKAVTGEIISRNPPPGIITETKITNYTTGAVGSSGYTGYIEQEKRLPNFANGDFCRAFKDVANVKGNFNCGTSITIPGAGAATGGGDIGHGMYIIGLTGARNCWQHRGNTIGTSSNNGECLKVYISIKKDNDEHPTFRTKGEMYNSGTPDNPKSSIRGVVDHFGFNIYPDGFVEPMIDTVSSYDGTSITPYGVAADMVTVDVVIDSADDEIFGNHQNLLRQLITHASSGTGGDLKRDSKGDRALQLHNTGTFTYFESGGTGGKTARSMTSNATNFVDAIKTQADGGTFCEFGLVCKLGFEDNTVPVSAGAGGAVSTQTINIPDFRQKQMNDANVLFFKIPYRRALAMKNRLEFVSSHTHHIGTINSSGGCGVDTCAQKQSGVLEQEARNCLEKRKASLRDNDRLLYMNYGSGTANNYCNTYFSGNNSGSTDPERSLSAAKGRRVCRLIEVSLR